MHKACVLAQHSARQGKPVPPADRVFLPYLAPRALWRHCSIARVRKPRLTDAQPPAAGRSAGPLQFARLGGKGGGCPGCRVPV